MHNKFFILVLILVALTGQMVFAEKNETDFSEAWRHFYSERYKEAMGEVKPLLKSKKEAVKVEAMHLASRIYWKIGVGSDSKKYRASALKLWGKLEKISTLNVNKKRLQIAAALQKDVAGESKRALELLNRLMVSDYPATCTSEAAILYAQIKYRLGDRKAAVKACEFAAVFADKLTRSMGNESLSNDEVRAFIEEAKRLEKELSRKPTKRDPAGEAFEKAERLRNAKKWPQAVKAYRLVMQKFPDTDYATRSELHMGHCYLGEGHCERAMKLWEEFIQSNVSGAWRGQACVEMIDIYLDRMLDLVNAERYAKIARNGLQVSSRESSWVKVSFDIFLREGTIEYVKGDYKKAASQLTLALQSIQKNDRRREGIKRLIGAAKKGLLLIPKEMIERCNK